MINFSPPFRKVPALEACIAKANPDDIIFIMDVDMEYRPNIVDRVRRSLTHYFCLLTLERYVVEGKRLYAPIVWYLDKDPDTKEFFEHNPAGWAYHGTGIIALVFQHCVQV